MFVMLLKAIRILSLYKWMNSQSLVFSLQNKLRASGGVLATSAAVMHRETLINCHSLGCSYYNKALVSEKCIFCLRQSKKCITSNIHTP